jgi:hypothetical protein
MRIESKFWRTLSMRLGNWELSASLHFPSSPSTGDSRTSSLIPKQCWNS